MADISNNKTKKIPKAAYLDMESRVVAWRAAHNDKNPNIVYIDNLRKDYVSYTRYVDIHDRFHAWYHAHNDTYPNYVYVVAQTQGGTTPAATYQHSPTRESETTIYAGSPTVTVKSTPQIYTGNSVPYYKCTINYGLFAADSVEFESPNYYEDGTKIKVIGQHQPFGGVVTGRKETANGYTYSCLDHTMKLFGKWGISFYDARVSDIIKIMCTQVGLPTNGIKSTTTVHPRIIVAEETRFNIAQQLAGLEAMEFFMHRDGIPILRYEPEMNEGYIFYTDEAASEYGVEYSSSDIITSVNVYGVDSTFLYNYKNDKLIVKYGYITEYINDSNITTKAEAKAEAQKLIKEKMKVQFTGNLVIPKAIDIKKGEWCVVVPPSWSKHSIKAYYVSDVKVDITPDGETTTISLLNSKPAPPSEWIYTPPDEDNDCNSTGTGSALGLRSGVSRRSTGCSSDSYSNFYYTETDGKCPNCGSNKVVFDTWKSFTWNGVYYPNPCSGNGDGGYTCLDCDADYDGVSGYDSAGSCGSRITINNKKKVSGPVRVSTTGLPCGTSKATVRAKLISLLTGETESTCTTKVSGDNTTLSQYVPSNINSPKLIREWVDNNIPYDYYYDSKWPGATEAQVAANVLKRKKGNCYDQSCLVATLLRMYGYTASVVHLNVSGGCGGYVGGHYNVHVKINGAYKTIDTTCHGFNQV